MYGWAAENDFFHNKKTFNVKAENEVLRFASESFAAVQAPSLLNRPSDSLLD